MLKLVPFKDTWIGNDKIHIRAIYRRPRFVQDEYGEFAREHDANGNPTWDLTGAQQVKHHTHLLSKGFEYVTLADRDSLVIAAKFGTIEGGWQQYDQHQTGGPWNYKKYMEGQIKDASDASVQLKADVERFGSDAVETIRRQSDKDFVLPVHLRDIPAGGRAVETKAPTQDAVKEKDRKREASGASA